ncbi:MAG: hypothetical protein HKM04_11445 [Legionellales bacterium]|nr:hypothetical protein [Legionellales bacterium]
MDFNEENIQKLLPPYLTQDKKEHLEKAIKSFPNIEYFTRNYMSDILQGDIWNSLEVHDAQSSQKKLIKGILLSNSCDMDRANKRYAPILITFAPIIKLSDYSNFLKKYGPLAERVDDKICAIRNQHVSNIFYLPTHPTLEEEHIALLDDLHTIKLDSFEKVKERQKLLTLSQIGFYVFLFKLSVHFCRFHEGIDRYPSYL